MIRPWLRKVPVYTLPSLCCNLAPNNNEFGDHASVAIFSPGSGLVR
ncbi:A/G-specific adenine glycosylase [Escherichia coli H605]|uniref:A/G-specific adenine glycosylase n=1 Tax=Escherichia coli H605 TaxID=656410 RepID=A0AAJ3TZ53_ECOLX|nr:adenine glycosylase [Escherichia coli]OSL46687.1 A/G-specific adenine glycosylase [Escherichia coli H605]PSZ20183.1 adenine glycosylase [Escherichia sp. 4726-5]